MKGLYNYENNIKLVTTPNGDKVITMNAEILVSMRNALHDASVWQEEQGLDNLAKETSRLRGALLEEQ